ncbi:Ger(x)C family spore germination protein [Sporosarcina sp. PTS2304]|uniref:Ger(x)C family spore germination protein n=1 Tax=Sporosarcina sp. PTS2304 TaxID=2283194 RepID=UPI000E0D3410|nr:Ger(x)C family spore germination protein [Sporosarcina sp. PTS2304]AXI00095.1 Ger(x)C family spore germination protein [Sporosarcina sp. PTS2304]
MKKSRYIKMCMTFCVVSSVLLQAGCGFKDIDKKLFILAVGIDPSENIENGIKVTLKIALPFGAIKDSPKPSYAYISQEGASIGEAVRMLETHVDKVLELGHLKTIIIHEDLLSSHTKHFMDFFVRRGDIQMIAYVAGARPSAEKILKVEPATEAPASVALFNFFGDTANESPFIVTTYLFQMRREHYSKGIDIVLPLLETTEKGDELVINNAVVINEKKPPITLTIIETKYYNTLLKGATGAIYHVQHDQLQLLLTIKESKMNFKIIENDYQVPEAIEVHVKMKGSIGESNEPLSLSKLNVYNEISSKDVEKKVYNLLVRMQEEHVDPFGFGLRYRATRLHRSDIDEVWENAYPTLDFNVRAEVSLQSTGSIE